MTDSKATEKKTFDLPYTVVLKDPVQPGEKVYTEVVFTRKPRVKSMRNVPIKEEAMEFGHFFPLVVDMTGLPPVVIEELSMTDFTVCMEVANSFF